MSLLVQHDDWTTVTPKRFAAFFLIAAVAWGLGYMLWMVTHNVFFHPLRKYPGPKLWAITNIPYSRLQLSGDGHRQMLRMHMTYGPIVRVAPDALCYCHPDAMKEIKGHRKSGMPEHGKCQIRHASNRNNIIGANREDHTRYRRILANGFSHQAMIDQQPIIKKHVDTLFRQLKKESAGGTKKINIVHWFNYATFDIIGDLSFGEPFGCLEDSAYHPWVSLIFISIVNFAYLSVFKRFNVVSWFLQRYFMPKHLATKWAEHRELSAVKVQGRLASGTDRPDFIAAMTTKRGGGEALTFDEIAANASMLIVAGSETTATTLSAAAYYLASHSEPLAKLTAEVRSTFAREEDIDLLSVQHLTYLLAVLDESMRLYPPAPASQPRTIAEGGATILGHYVPAGTSAEVWQWTQYHHPDYFTHADEFIPERWLGDPRFANDKKEAFQPFSIGPRNCIGKNLAYAEMRLMLARLVWNFDLKLTEDSIGWDKNSKVWILWQKGPVNVYLSPRKF